MFKAMGDKQAMCAWEPVGTKPEDGSDLERAGTDCLLKVFGSGRFLADGTSPPPALTGRTPDSTELLSVNVQTSGGMGFHSILW